MLLVTFLIFNTTKALLPRNNLFAWAVGTKTWPQKVVVFWNYYKGGHRRAEKVAVYYTFFAIVFFIFSTVYRVLLLVFFRVQRTIITTRMSEDGYI
jgi:hypothetical protein